MKYVSLIVLSLLLIRCNHKTYTYNICNFSKRDSLNLLKDTYIHIDEFQYNNLDSSTSFFYGCFMGTNDLDKKRYNFLIFNSPFSKQQIEEHNGSGTLAIMVYQNIECFNFTSTIVVDSFIDNQKPVIVGKLVLVQPN